MQNNEQQHIHTSRYTHPSAVYYNDASMIHGSFGSVWKLEHLFDLDHHIVCLKSFNDKLQGNLGNLRKPDHTGASSAKRPRREDA